jgi:hypothetical protein
MRAVECHARIVGFSIHKVDPSRSKTLAGQVESDFNRGDAIHDRSTGVRAFYVRNSRTDEPHRLELSSATPLTSRLIEPIQLDDETVEVVDTPKLSFYLKVLFPNRYTWASHGSSTQRHPGLA